MHPKNSKLPRLLPLILVTLISGLVACGKPNETEENLTENTTPAEEDESQLTLDDVTLEQASEEGMMLWRVKSKQAKYHKDREVVAVQYPEGELFQDGKVIYTVTGQTGEVYQDGKKILLRGQILANDLENKIVLRGRELEWLPQENTLILRYNFTGENDEVQGSAQAAKIFTQEKRMELYGEVTIRVLDPVVQLRTEMLVWLMDNRQFISDRPVQIDRFEDKKVIGRAFAEKSEFDLKSKTAILKENARAIISDPPLQIDSEYLTWDVEKEIVTSPSLVTVLEKDEDIVLRGNKGQGDLKKKTFVLQGNVVGIGKQEGRQLNSDRLTWYFESETFDAVGNVVYRQFNPQFNVTGTKATGQLKGDNVVVEGDRNDVITEIFTNE